MDLASCHKATSCSSSGMSLICRLKEATGHLVVQLWRILKQKRIGLKGLRPGTYNCVEWHGTNHHLWALLLSHHDWLSGVGSIELALCKDQFHTEPKSINCNNVVLTWVQINLDWNNAGSHTYSTSRLSGSIHLLHLRRPDLAMSTSWWPWLLATRAEVSNVLSSM